LAAKHLQTGHDWYRRVLQYRNDTAGDDGALSSAVPAYAMGNYSYAQFNFMYTMLSSTGVNIAAEYPKLPLYANWLWWLWIRDSDRPVSLRHAGVGDSFHNTNLMSSIPLYEQLSQFMQFYKNLDPDTYGMMAALREFSRHTTVRNHVYPVLPFIVDTDHPSKPYYLDVLNNSSLHARHFETLGQIYMRSAFAKDATYCSFTAGATLQQHKHFDENNFTIFKYDHLALDSGDRCKETDFNLVYYYSQSVAHNVVLVHKPDEPLPYHWGIKIKDDPQANMNYGGMVKMTGSKVKAFETNDQFTYIASDATECYGDKCTEAVRQFVFLYPDYIIVYDRMDSADPSYRKEWLLHTKNKPVVKKGVMRADSNDGRLFCQTFLPVDAKIEVIGGKGNEFLVGHRNYPMDPDYKEEHEKDAVRRARGPYWGNWRLEVEPSSAREDDRFLHVLTAASVDAFKPVDAKYVSDAQRDGVRVRFDGHDVTFWFNRTGEIGGAVEYDGVVSPLTNEVQQQTGFIY
jgi:heparin/heparan-sulfate lyase